MGKSGIEQIAVSSQGRILWIVAAVCLILFGNTLFNGYALDDEGLIYHNSMTESGIRAIPEIFTSGYRATLTHEDHELYRPVPKAVFAVSWTLFSAHPVMMHLLSILLFTMVCITLYLLLSKYLGLSVEISFVTVILYCAHPIHTEVVANCKGIEELLSLLFALLAFRIALSEKSAIFRLTGVSLLYFIAILSKESAIVFAGIIPVTSLLIKKQTVKQSTLMFGVLALTTVAYLSIRINVAEIQYIMPDADANYLVTIPDMTGRIIQSLYIVLVYFKQLFFPIYLTSDGSYAYLYPINGTDKKFLAGLAGMLLVVAVSIKFRKTAPEIAGGIVFFAISLLPVSNLFFLIGTQYAERLLFVPSIGFCLVLATVLIKWKKLRNETGIFSRITPLTWLIALLISGYGIITFERNRDWKNNFTLFNADIKTAPESARLNCYYANVLSETEYLNSLSNPMLQSQEIQKAILAYRKAIQILPDFDKAIESLGELCAKTGNAALADSCFRSAIRLRREATYFNNYGNFLFNLGKPDSAMVLFREALQINPNYAEAYCNFGSAYGAKAKILLTDTANQKETNAAIGNSLLDSALLCFNRSIELNPYFPDAYRYSAMILNFKGDKTRSAEMSQRFEKLTSVQTKQNRLIHRYTRNYN